MNLQSTLIKLLLRRGLTMLGTAGATVSDEWITQTASLVLVLGNELWQYLLAKKAEKRPEVAKMQAEVAAKDANGG